MTISGLLCRAWLRRLLSQIFKYGAHGCIRIICWESCTNFRGNDIHETDNRAGQFVCRVSRLNAAGVASRTDRTIERMPWILWNFLYMPVHRYVHHRNAPHESFKCGTAYIAFASRHDVHYAQWLFIRWISVQMRSQLIPMNFATSWHCTRQIARHESCIIHTSHCAFNWVSFRFASCLIVIVMCANHVSAAIIVR